MAISRSITLLALSAAVVTLGACGSEEDPSSTLPEPPETPAPAEPGAGPAVDDGVVIGTSNRNGVVVDPQPHPIDADIQIMESYPEQIGISFTAGDPNCLAADAWAIAVGDTVGIYLDVGITEDALSRSCVAGDFEHRMSIALTEGLDGRDVVIADRS